MLQRKKGFLTFAPVCSGAGAGHPGVEGRLRSEEEPERQHREAETAAAAATSCQEACHHLAQ